MSDSVLLMMVMKRAPSAPSITRWSKERNRQHQTRHELFTIPHRLHRGLGNAEDSHFRRIHNRREVGITRPPMLEMVKQPPAFRPQSAYRHALFLEMVISSRDSSMMPFFVDVFEYRDNQTVRGIHRHTDVDVFLQGQTLTVFRQRTVEARHLLRAAATAFMMKTTGGDLHIQLTFRCFFVLLFTERFPAQ